VDTSYFIAIAKLRALRLLIPQVLGAFDVDVGPSAAFIQAVTSCRSETRYGPYVNLLRGTTEAASAIIGGCDVLTVRPFSASFAAPSDFAQRLARNTQHILRAESHLDHVADPAAGSYYVEAMTDHLARNAWSFFQRVEASGGLLDALHHGTVQRQIADVRMGRMERVTNREHILVGTNHYPAPNETRPPSEPLLPDGAPLERTERSIRIQSDTALSDIRTAFSNGATIGDVLDALADDDAPSIDALPSVRLAEPFEAIRKRTEEWAEENDGPPRVVLLPMGDPAMRSARATFARNVLGVAGFAIDEHIQFETPDAAAQEAAEANADIVVLCSSNNAYPELAPALCSTLAEAGAAPIMLIAGHLPEHQDKLEAAGVDGFIHKDMPLLDTLTDLQQRLGIRSETEP
jgi:methylmalonyl-CoA mutase